LGVICDLLPCHELLGLGSSQNGFALEKALPDRMALRYGCLDKSTCYCEPLRVIRTSSND
jgi:hypothetical protein